MAVELEFEKKSKALLALQDSLVMVRRSSTHIIRNTDQLLGTFFQPIMFLVLFTAVFGGAIATEGGSYTNFLMAGIIMPLTFASTAFVSANQMSDWLRPFAENQPVSQMVDAVRALFIGDPAGNSIWLSFVWGVAILAISIPVAAWLFKRKTAQ